MLVDVTMVSRELDGLVVITLLLDTIWCDCSIYFKIVIISPMIAIPRAFKYSFVSSGKSNSVRRFLANADT